MSRPIERTFAVLLAALVPFVPSAAIPCSTSQPLPVCIGVALSATGPIVPGGLASPDALRPVADEATRDRVIAWVNTEDRGVFPHR